MKYLITLLFVFMSIFSFGQKFKSIKPEKVCEYVKQHPGVVLLDVRTKEEYEGTSYPEHGTLKNAVNIPVQELESRIGELDSYKNKEVIVYCSYGKRSVKASNLLAKSGFSSIYNLDGGITELKNGDCIDRSR